MLGSWTRTIARALEHQGIDPAPLVVQAGLDPVRFADPNARHPNTATNRLWRLAAEAAGDPCFGLTASRFVTETTFQALGYSVLASATLKDVFERYVRYGRMVSDAGVLRLEAGRDRYRLTYEIPRGLGRPADEAMDAILLQAVRTGRALLDRSLNPLRVDLERAEPTPSDAFARAFRAPIHFAAKTYALEFARDAIEAPLPAGNAELARQTDEVVARYLAEIDHQDIAARVRLWLVDRLSGGEPTQESAARALGLGLRSLQRRLADEGTSYRELLAGTRLDLARGYLTRGRYSVAEITFLLGFAEPSAFSRAFRRWTGSSPTAYRTEGPGLSSALEG